jgi:arylsulfatase A-like enzyme
MVLDGLARRRFANRHPTDPGRELTPNLDRFFSTGFYAPNGYSSSEWTLPTTASFFTGEYASRHRMVHPNWPMCYKPTQKLLAECFQEEGYHTLGFSCGNRLTPAFGSHRGFDRFVYHWAFEGRSTFDYDPSVWISEIIGHLDSHRLDKTFTYVHFPDTHPAWNLSPLNRSFNLARRGDSTGHNLDRLENSALGAEQGRQILLLRLHEFDRAIDSLLRYVEIHHSDDSLIVLTADHGTPWPDFHDKHTREIPPLNELRTGTFIQMRGVGVPNKYCSAPVAPNLDLMPTLLNIAGINVPCVSDGMDLFSASDDRPNVISESIYRGVYEVAVNDLNRQWIKRFPIDEKLFRITGPSYFQGGFPTGCTDYSVPAFTEDNAGDQIIDDHIRCVGLVSQ